MVLDKEIWWTQMVNMKCDRDTTQKYIEKKNNKKENKIG